MTGEIVDHNEEAIAAVLLKWIGCACQTAFQMRMHMSVG